MSDIYREAADPLGYSRPDALLRAWQAAGLRVYRRRSGRNLVALADFERFIESDYTAMNEERSCE